MQTHHLEEMLLTLLHQYHENDRTLDKSAKYKRASAEFQRLYEIAKELVNESPRKDIGNLHIQLSDQASAMVTAAQNQGFCDGFKTGLRLNREIETWIQE